MGATSSLIGGSGAADIYKIFAIAQSDGKDLRVASVPRDFDVQADELFDPRYMSALFSLGHERGTEGIDWLPPPSDYRPFPR